MQVPEQTSGSSECGSTQHTVSTLDDTRDSGHLLDADRGFTPSKLLDADRGFTPSKLLDPTPLLSVEQLGLGYTLAGDSESSEGSVGREQSYAVRSEVFTVYAPTRTLSLWKAP